VGSANTPIGEGPPGSTPLDPDEADALVPTHITTQGELNAWEQLNISRASAWVLSRRRRPAMTVLTASFASELHRRMFNRSWKWAGAYRRSAKNIGVSATQVRTALVDRLDDAAYWLRERAYPLDEIAVRMHYQLVVVHPWPNGNGRWARLMADALIHAEDSSPLSWGSGDLMAATDVRARYIAALKEADRGNFDALLSFAR
jgi:Fic-DOC domain mobile mystery protein B